MIGGAQLRAERILRIDIKSLPAFRLRRGLLPNGWVAEIADHEYRLEGPEQGVSPLFAFGNRNCQPVDVLERRPKQSRYAPMSQYFFPSTGLRANRLSGGEP